MRFGGEGCWWWFFTCYCCFAYFLTQLVVHLWKLDNDPERTKNISNPMMYSFFIFFFFIFHSNSTVSAHLSSKIWICRLCKLLFLSLYTLTSERKKNDFYLSNFISTNFLQLSLSAAELKMFCGDDGNFSAHPLPSHRWGPKAPCKKWRKIIRYYFSGTT